MKISRIYVSTCLRDYPLTQCCVASIRHWYPKIPILLIKDDIENTYDTSELEKAWDVAVFPTKRQSFGLGWGKVEALSALPSQRALIIDSDIVFTGSILEPLERFEEDFVVVEENHPTASIEAYYFSLPLLKQIDPEFHFPGFVFNAGQIVATTGVLTWNDFSPFLREEVTPQILRPDIFPAGDQSLINYLLLKKMTQGLASLRRHPFMHWGNSSTFKRISLLRMLWRSPYNYLVHWAGPKSTDLGQIPQAYLLKFFFLKYHLRVPGGWRKYFTRRYQQKKWRNLTTSAPSI